MAKVQGLTHYVGEPLFDSNGTALVRCSKEQYYGLSALTRVLQLANTVRKPKQVKPSAMN